MTTSSFDEMVVAFDAVDGIDIDKLLNVGPMEDVQLDANEPVVSLPKPIMLKRHVVTTFNRHGVYSNVPECMREKSTEPIMLKRRVVTTSIKKTKWVVC